MSRESIDNVKIVDKHAAGNPDRGRSIIENGPRVPNPLARAESQHRRNNASIEVDAQPIEKRALSRSSTFFDDPADVSAAFDDNFLEPCPHLSICDSVSEVLAGRISLHHASVMNRLRAVTSSAYEISLRELEVKVPTRALTTTFCDCKPLFPAPIRPPGAAQSLPNIGHLEHLASSERLRPRCRSDRPPGLAAQLPSEIIQQIFYYLPPVSFNSARHICRSWFISRYVRPRSHSFS